MSFDAFKEVTISNPGSATRYGSDDVLDVMKILNGKVVSTRRPIISNRWRWISYQEIQQMAEASVPTPTDSNVVNLFQSATDNHLKVKKTGGTIVDLENIGSGTWSNTSTETFSNKTVNFDTNTLKHSTTNATGDIMFYDATAAKYIRLAKGTANQSLTVNAAGTTLEWATVTGGGGGGEANTASNIGTAGIGLFFQKLGVDLQFKQLFSPDGSVNISDDTGNQKIDLTLPAGVAKTGAQNTFGDFQNTFRSGRLAITNPANSAAYFWVGSAISASRNVTLPLLTANDQMTCDTFPTNLLNKTLGTGTVANTDVISLKHSTTNTLGELLVNTGTKFDRKAKGAADTYLKVNASGTDLEWGSIAIPTSTIDDLTDVTITSPAIGHLLAFTGSVWANKPKGSADTYLKVNSAGTDLEWAALPPAPQATPGIKLPDGTTTIPGSGRWGAFYGGSGNGMGMMGFAPTYSRLYGGTSSASESSTQILSAATTNAIAEFKTGCAFRRDSQCVFKAKWYLTSAASCKVKIGLSDAPLLPAGGSASEGPLTTRYDVNQSSSGHLEMDTPSRFGVRFDSGASGLNQAVREVTVRWRNYGSPSGSATVGIRKNSDGTLVSLGTFTPGSFGSGERSTTISAPTNTYLMLTNDRVSIEFPANASNGIEIDQDDAASPSGYTSQQWTGSSWSAADATVAMQIKTVTISGGGGTSGDTPLANDNGVMVHGTIGTHSNYQIARNNGLASAVVVDSGVPLANTSTHTVVIDLNSTDIKVTLDGNLQTLTTTLPALSTAMGWFMHVEAAAASEKGLGIVYAQVVMTS